MHACDRQTDRQTDGQTEFSSLDRVCIPCSAVKTDDQSKSEKDAAYTVGLSIRSRTVIELWSKKTFYTTCPTNNPSGTVSGTRVTRLLRNSHEHRINLDY